MRRRILLTTAVLLTGTVALTAFYRHGAAAEPELTTTAVSRGDVVETVKATGTLQAVTTVQVGTQVSGTIAALLADFNSQVQEGPGRRPARPVAVPDPGRPGRGHGASSCRPTPSARGSRSRTRRSSCAAPRR